MTVASVVDSSAISSSHEASAKKQKTASAIAQSLGEQLLQQSGSVATASSQPQQQQIKYSDAILQALTLIQSADSDLPLLASEKPRSGTLHTMLQQAIESSNEPEIEWCLMQASKTKSSSHGRFGGVQLCVETVKKLSPRLVMRLLQICIVRLEARPSRAAEMLVWIQAALTHHCAALIQLPLQQQHQQQSKQPQMSLMNILERLIALMSARLANMPRLLRLTGKLDILTHQMNRTQSMNRVWPGESTDSTVQSANVVNGPLLTFNDAGLVQSKPQLHGGRKRRNRNAAHKAAASADHESDDMADDQSQSESDEQQAQMAGFDGSQHDDFDDMSESDE